MRQALLAAVVAVGLAGFGCQDQETSHREAPPAQGSGTGGSGQAEIDDAERVDPHTMGGTDMKADEPATGGEVGVGAKGSEFDEPALQDDEAGQAEPAEGAAPSSGSEQPR